jgi:hypothetical protein
MWGCDILSAMRDHMAEFWAAVISLIILGLLMWGLYACTNNDCEARGGHTEQIYSTSGDVAWTCVGAEVAP